ncbi:hypothetical protein JKF63_01932 [Porcisia hertigi]|uniref:Uncharacterized protein n=1 Tax=Porcisia hertigi TaxID=2761500 RepID=A0A836H5M7_9TRYP|nr:hypothetical protein JKF63_01932 [Porcisia hertigi]
MRSTRLWQLRVSLRVLEDGHGTQVENLGRRWAELDAARSGTVTGLATELLKKTISSLQECAPALTSSGVPSPKPAAPSLADFPPFLSSKESAQRIWRSLRRQRVQWQDALALLPWQLLTLTPAQQQFLRSRVARSPERVIRLVLAAWDLHEDAALVQQYRSLRRAAYMVEYARLVSAALRERPALPNGLLPVPYSVMQHGYALGRRSPQDAKIALELSKHMTLLGREALPRRAEESLVLSHVTLEGLVGEWQAALSIVLHSRAVRPSAREGMERYVRSLTMRQITPPIVSPVQLEQSHRSSASLHGNAEAGFRNDSISTARLGSQNSRHPEDTSIDWVKGLRAFITKEPHAQTYPDARKVLDSLPPEVKEDRMYLLLASTVLQCCVRRMFAGTLTRRVVSCINKADWVMALALTCAAQYYDVAAPLIPCAAKTSSDAPPRALDLPSDLRAYVTAAQRLKQERLPIGAAPSSLSATSATALAYPEALAHALAATSPATWRTLLLSCPHTTLPTRLRYFLLAACDEAGDSTVLERPSEGLHTRSEIECCTFQSRTASRLVCAAAERRNQQYFFKVIPASVRAHHFERSPLTNAPTLNFRSDSQRLDVSAAAAADDTQSVAHDFSHTANSRPTGSILGGGSRTLLSARLQSWRHQVATTPEECARLLSDVSLYLRETHTIEGVAVPANQKPRLTEEFFLKCIAALTASGVVQLSSSERFHWPLAVFKAARLLRVSIDASLVALTTRTIPSMFVDQTSLALPPILNAYTLVGDWKAGLQLCTRLLRKHRSGELRIDSDTPRVGTPQTHKFTAPPPTLLEAMAQVGYASPAAAAVRHWNALESVILSTDASPQSERSCSLALLLLELHQFHDDRQLCDEVRHACKRESLGGAQQKLSCTSRSRMLLGAAFCLLSSEAALRRVLRAAGKEKARAPDVDAHGLQRLLRVLGAPDAALILAAEAREGRCAQEHWLCKEMSRSDTTADVIGDLARLRPFSATLSALRFYKLAAAAHDLVGCLKALVRLVERASDCAYPDVLLLALLRLLRSILSHGGLLSESVVRRALGESEAPAVLPHPVALTLAYMLFNRMQEMERLSLPLKDARRALRRAFEADLSEGATVAGSSGADRTGKPPAPPCAVWTVLGLLHSTTSSVLQVPVPASFTSDLLSRVMETSGSADWVAALLFFRNLRHPTMQERMLLVCALRHCGVAATSILLSQHRFLRDCPEQVVIWANEAGGHSKWVQSLALLESVQESVRSETAAEAKQDSTKSSDSVNTPEALLSPVVVTIIHGWNADERLRCGELLRRQGFIVMRSTTNGKSLHDARVSDMANARVQQQTEAILQLLKENPASAVSSINGSPPALDTAHAGLMAARQSRQ